MKEVIGKGRDRQRNGSRQRGMNQGRKVGVSDREREQKMKEGQTEER